MDEDINFMDVVLISRIDNETTLENYGGRVNTSFFESANLLGTLKVKGLVYFEQSIGGQSPVKLTEKAVTILNLLKERGEEKVSQLDLAILKTIIKGATNHVKIENQLNVASFDIALHLYKIYIKGFIDYTLRNGKLIIRLTEKGFKEINKTRGEIKPTYPKPVQKKEHPGTEIKHEPKQYLRDTKSAPAPSVPYKGTEIKEKMRQSKINYYMNKYWWLGIFIFIILLVAVYILFRTMF